MRLTLLALAAVTALALGACSKKTTDESATQNATAAPAAAASAAANTSGKNAAAPAEAPVYPGARTLAAGSSGAMTSFGKASGKVLSSNDSFAKVYDWYKGKLPAASAKTHVQSAGAESAVFVLGEAGKDQESVTITSSAAQPGKTMITIAHIKR